VTRVTSPYWSGDGITLYLGDCREVTEWLAAAVLVMDPPYGRKWRQGRHWDPRHTDDRHQGIQGDADTAVRDAALAVAHR
jgi:site-specific DNA-methyltransferase (adenine-specific)